MDTCVVKLASVILRVTLAVYWSDTHVISPEPFVMVKGLWVGFSLYWLISALRRRAVKEKEPWFDQLRHLLPMLVGFALVFTTDLHFGLLGRRFVSRSGASNIIGLWLTGAGLAFAIWAQWHLGENWSAVVSIRPEHELIGAPLPQRPSLQSEL